MSTGEIFNAFFFVSLEVTFFFLIKISTLLSIEIEIAFFHDYFKPSFLFCVPGKLYFHF